MNSDTTNWACELDSSVPGKPSATLDVSINFAEGQSITLKGMCYSPCPINGSNGFAPALGDWFWSSYSGTGYSITGWGVLWARDLSNIRALGVNTLRVYSMLSRQLNGDGTYPNPWNSGQLMTHVDFLDACWNGGTNPLYVLAGIPMPQAMYWLTDYNNTPADEKSFWENVLTETVTNLSSHPAIVGFIIQNELDSELVTWPNPPSQPTNLDDVDFWWEQVAKFSAAAKTAMGSNKKLVGMAVHDAPQIPTYAQSYMANVPDLDFWGVNTYQTQSFDPVFDDLGSFIGYNSLAGDALKPVLLTEWGMPATSHHSASDPSTIYADTSTIARAAAIVSSVAPDAYLQPLNLGLYYFEYCDEWWNQNGSPNIYTWYGGAVAAGFPNGYWDQEGFGLYAQSRGLVNNKPLPNNAPIWQQTGGTGAPALPVDVATARSGTVTALTTVFQSN